MAWVSSREHSSSHWIQCSARRLRGPPRNRSCRRVTALLRFPRRTENDRIAGLQCDQDLEDGCRGRIRNRDDGQDRSDRLSDFRDSADRVVGNRTYCLQVFDIVVDELARHGVLDHFVLPAAKARLLAGKFGQLHAIAKRCLVHGPDDAVGVGLRKLAEYGGRRFGPLEVHVHVRRACAAGLNHVLSSQDEPEAGLASE